MLLDVQVVIENFLWVFLILVTIVIFKTGVIIGLSRLFGANLSVAFRTGMSLAQAGEFGFVLLAQASTLGVIDNTVLQPVLAAMVLSLFIAPFLIEYREVIIRRSYNSDWMQKAMQITSIAAHNALMCWLLK